MHLTFDPLTLKVRGTSSITWSKPARNLSKTEQSPAELLIILQSFAHIMYLCHAVTLTFDLELLQHLGCHALKLCTKSEQSQIIHGWVIDDLACFRRAVLEGRVSGVRGPNFIKLGEGDHFYIRCLFSVQISCCIFKCGWLKVELC